MLMNLIYPFIGMPNRIPTKWLTSTSRWLVIYNDWRRWCHAMKSSTLWLHRQVMGKVSEVLKDETKRDNKFLPKNLNRHGENKEPEMAGPEVISTVFVSTMKIRDSRSRKSRKFPRRTIKTWNWFTEIRIQSWPSRLWRGVNMADGHKIEPKMAGSVGWWSLLASCPTSYSQEPGAVWVLFKRN